jgi:hypothetical protein
LNSFSGHTPSLAGLREEIAFINRDLPVKPANPGHRAGGSKKKNKGLRLLKRA